MISYRIIAPLIMPKLKRATESKDLKQLCFFWNKDTSEQRMEITNESGTKEFHGSVSIKEILTEGIGKKLLNLLEKEYPNWNILYGVIDSEKKKITFIFKNNEHTIGTRIY
jgi:hypothetical protein